MHPSRSVVPSLLALAALVGANSSGLLAQQPALAADRAPGAAAVDVAQCKQWLHTLAGPEFEGRGTGQPGYEKAANYVAAHFKALGLEARGENGTYFQNMPWTMTAVDATKSTLEFLANGKVVHSIPVDRLTGTCSSNFEATGDVVFVRPTLTTVEPAANDGQAGGRRPRASVKVEGLDGAELKGKVVVVNLPPSDDRMAAAMGRFAVIRELQGKECAVVLFAQKDAVSGGLRGRGGMGRGGGNRAAAGAGRSPFDGTFGGDDFTKLFTAAGSSVDGLQQMPATTAMPLQCKVHLEVAETQAPAMNVFAVLPGSDPQKKDEYVVIGSHLDHLGRNGDRISPGADDDGSGTTGVMAVAQMFAKNPQKPARSVLFVCFSGEESGLLGSGHFAKNCPIPLSSMVAELQMDMIGRDEEENMEGDKGEKAEDNRNSLHLIGTKKLAPALHDLCMAKNGTAKFDLEWDQEGMFSRSDHANFAKYGVPIAFFFTGLHKDYHQTTDTPDKIHYEKLLRVAQYVYDIGFELGVQNGRPEIDSALWAKYSGKAGKEPAAPMSAGAKSDAGKPDGGK